MEANIEEPLSTDDIAGLVGISRRQLERLFKQYLGSLPSRYYLELRLQRARQLLLEHQLFHRPGGADVRLLERLALLDRLRRPVRQHPARRTPAQARQLKPPGDLGTDPDFAPECLAKNSAICQTGHPYDGLIEV
jgi:AraC-like DNA-binding protein